MDLETLCCNSCGAPLTVPGKTNFVTCNHCSTRLAIRRTESTTFTEQIEQIDAKQDEVLERLDRIEKQNQVADLDRDWAAEQQQFMIRGKNGQKHLPSRATVFGGIVAAVFGLFWTIFAGSMFPPMAIVGVIFIVAAIGTSIYANGKMKDYNAAHRRYRRRRRELSEARSSDKWNTRD